MSRLFYTKGTYSNKVLVGDWVNSRFDEVPKPLTVKDKYCSLYQESYTPKAYNRADKAKAWDQRLDSENTKIFSDVGRFDQVGNTFENFSSMYDLSYNHFPKCYKSYIPRLLKFRRGYHVPTDEYLHSFGNITKYGILDQKKSQWECDIESLKVQKRTSYNEHYKQPKPEDYAFRRHATPMKNSSAMSKVNNDCIDLKLRGIKVYSVAEPDRLAVIEQEKSCDPITWECPDHLKTPPIKRCVEM